MRRCLTSTAPFVLVAAAAWGVAVPAVAAEPGAGERTMLFVGVILAAGTLCAALVIAAVWFFIRVAKGKEKV